MDGLMDIIFSSASNNILREEFSPLLNPSNYLVPPNPKLPKFFFADEIIDYNNTLKKTGDSNINESILNKNRTRRLVGKNALQTKFFAPPKNDNVIHLSENLYVKISMNQQYFVDLYKECITEYQQNYGNLASMIISRVSSYHPVPTNEQYPFLYLL